MAWGRIGHGVVGEIAEQNLTPEAKNLVYSILGLEPLAIAAVWPDMVRSDSRFNKFSPYHYIEIPNGKKYEKLSKEEIVPKNAHTIISQVPSKLIDPKVSREEKAVLLRFLIHIVGDVHMPLHVGSGLGRGATLCLIKWRNPTFDREVLTNLHSFWDDSLFEFAEHEYNMKNPPFVGQNRFFGYQEFIKLSLGSDGKKSKLLPSMKEANKVSALGWYAESQGLHSIAYPPPPGDNKKGSKSYCKGFDPKTGQPSPVKIEDDLIPVVTEGFVRASLMVAQRRVFLAGLRLAGLLNATAKLGKIDALPEKAQTDLIKKMLLEN